MLYVKKTPSSKRSWLFLISRSDFFRAAVFLELVVECLEADSEDLGSAGFVVFGVLESAQDEPFFRFLHRCANGKLNQIGRNGVRSRRHSHGGAAILKECREMFH